MGILNLTPDSFSGDGLFNKSLESVRTFDSKSLKEGLDNAYKNFQNKKISIVDVGVESTKPGVQPLDIEGELSRINLYIENVNPEAIDNFAHSIDTYKHQVVKRLIKFNSELKRNVFEIVNDVSGGKDRRMIDLITKYNLGIILSHRHPDSSFLHEKFYYKDPVGEVKRHLSKQIQYLLDIGVQKDSIAIDPALGFGKDEEVSYEILDNIEKFSFGYPIVVGFSKKKFSLAFKMDTFQLTEFAFSKGVSVVRTHIS